MFLHYVLRGVFREFKACWSICGDLHFGGDKIFTRDVHSLPSGKYRCPSQSPCKEVSRKSKQYKKNVDRKVYMRDIVMEISNILRYSSWVSAQEQLNRLHIKWDSFTVNQVLKTHPPMEKAWFFFNWTSKQKGFKHDQFTCTTMLDIFGEAGRINSMMYVFHLMQEKGIKIDVFTYTSMFHWFSNSGDFDGAVKIWKEMKVEGCSPTVVSYTAFMKILFCNNKAEEAIGIYKEMLQSGLKPTCHTYTILMEHLIHSGKCKSALEIFRKMQEAGVQPDKPTCNILVEQSSKAKEPLVIIQILHYMKENSLVLRYPIYLQAYETLKMAGESDLLLRQVNPHISIGASDNIDLVGGEDAAYEMNCIIDKGLLVQFLSTKNFVAIDRLFAGMVQLNMQVSPELVSKIIEAYCSYGRTIEAFWVFEHSSNMGIYIEKEAFRSLMGVLIRTEEFSKILLVVEQMVKMDLFPEPELAASLMYRFGQAKALDMAVKLFNFFPEEMKTTALYTALVSAYLSAGQPDNGIETFKTMKRSGIQGALATYNVLIRGLEVLGRVEQAKFYRREKKILLKQENVSEAFVDESFCNVLFAGYMVP